jgi:hypothetical protein
VVFRLSVAALGAVSATPTYQTAVGVAPTIPLGAAVTSIIEPHGRDASSAYVRMGTRAEIIGMPPLATEAVDTDGREALGAWIDEL